MTSNILNTSSFQKNVRFSVRTLETLHHPFRQRLLKILQDYQTLNVEAIANLLNTKSSLVSDHLDELRRFRIVDIHLEGKQYFYSVNQTTLQKVHKLVCALGGHSF